MNLRSAQTAKATRRLSCLGSEPSRKALGMTALGKSGRPLRVESGTSTPQRQLATDELPRSVSDDRGFSAGVGPRPAADSVNSTPGRERIQSR